MNPVATLLIGLAMSADAFAAALGRGAGMRSPGFWQALKVGLIFGVIETLTPALGWLLGRVASAAIGEWDHWIALVLLAGLGLHMIHAGLSGSDDMEAAPRSQSLAATALAGLATSLDALAAGIGLAFLDVDIVAVALTIGACTVAMATAGVLLGARLGAMVGRRAEVLGGVVLIAVGLGIAWQHTAG